MTKLQELQKKRNQLADEIENLRNKFNEQGEKWLDDEQRAAWKQVNEDYNTLTQEMQQVREAEEVAKRAAEVAEAQERSSTPSGTTIPGRDDFDEREQRGQHRHIAVDHFNVALHGWCRHQAGMEVTDEHREACRQVGIRPEQREFPIEMLSTALFKREQALYQVTHPQRIQELHLRNLATSGSSGNLIPEGFVNRLERNMLAFGGMLQVAEILRTSSGNDLPWPTADDTGNVGEQLGEAASIGNSVDPTFSQMVLNAYKYSSKLVRVSTEILEDSAFDLVAYLGDALGERLGRILNQRFTTGTGTAQPNGIVTAATLGVTAASATAITADEIIQLIHSVDPAYRPGARFMMHDSIVLEVELLKDSEGNYLWRSGLENGRPDTIRGVGLTVNQDMDSALATTNEVMLYGQLSKYKVRIVRGVRMRRLVERYADTDEEGFIAFMRADGDLLDAGTAPVKKLQMA